MNPTAGQPRLTELLDNALLARVERLRLIPRSRFTSRMRGEHLAGKGGQCMEFADYRDYVEGDDLRFLDWNIFSRLRRPYLKIFHQEEQRFLAIVVDTSASMGYYDKLRRACQFAAAFAVSGLFSGEPVYLYAFGGEGGEVQSLGPLRGRPSLRRVFRYLEPLTPAGDTALEQGVERLLRTHRGRGMAILLSDFLTFGDLQKPFNALFAAGLETLALQILGPQELNPDLTDDHRLIDSELNEMLDVTSGGELAGIYAEYLTRFQTQLAQMAQQRNGRFLTVSTAQSPETVLLDVLRRKGWWR